MRLAKYDTLFQNFPLERMWELTGTGVVLTWRRELFVESQSMAEFPQPADTTFLHRVAQPLPTAVVDADGAQRQRQDRARSAGRSRIRPEGRGAWSPRADAAKLGNDWE